MPEEVRSDGAIYVKDREVFAEVSLFGAEMAGSDENGDCSCFTCDGNPCVK